MLEIELLERETDFDQFSKSDIVDFLHEFLNKFRDDKKSIENAINYALSDAESKGGFVLIGLHEKQLAGVLVMNNTGMSGYIPDHIIVYVATNPKFWIKGYGKEMIEKSLELCTGDVKLHVEYNNPARKLYEKIGFKNKYAEMRYSKN